MVIEVILPLPLLGTRAQQAHCKIGVIKRQYWLGGTVRIVAVVQTGQVFEIAVKLLYLLEELPDQHSIWLFEGIGDVKFHRLVRVMLKHGQEVEGHAVEK